MKKANLISKSEMKKVIGGAADLCAGKTGDDLAYCRYNVCMAGWNVSSHTNQENKDKMDSCAAIAGL